MNETNKILAVQSAQTNKKNKKWMDSNKRLIELTIMRDIRWHHSPEICLAPGISKEGKHQSAELEVDNPC